MLTMIIGAALAGVLAAGAFVTYSAAGATPFWARREIASAYWRQWLSTCAGGSEAETAAADRYHLR